MKRLTLTLAVAGALLVPALLLTGSASAANPHGDKGDPSASCGNNGNGNGACDNPGLPQSEGCLHGQAPVQNPHCQPAPSSGGSGGLVPAVPASNPNPGNSGGGNNPARGVAGAEAGGQASGDPGATGTAAAVGGKSIEQLPFTGLETLWLALVGAGMLALGLVLWVRTSSPRETPELATEPRAGEGGEAADWDVPELGIAPAVGRREVHLPFSEFESLGRLLMRKGKARLRAEPGGTLPRLRAGPGGALVVVLNSG
jgi:hypothetical protein